MVKSKSEAVPRAEFDALYRRQLGFVWRMLRYHGVPSEGMEDAVQDVFVVVHRRWHEWEREGSERAWLFGVVRRVASAHRRSAARHRRRLEVAPRPASPSSVEDRVASREALAQTEAILAAMKEPLRTAFVLSTIEGMSAPEIAELTGAKLNTVYGRLRVAKTTVAMQLRAALGLRSET